MLLKINTEKVKLFQQLFDEVGTELNNKDWQLRISLLREELQELKEAFDNKDYVEIADAYGDLLFLTIGGMYKHGVPLEEIVLDFDENRELNIQMNTNVHEWLDVIIGFLEESFTLTLSYNVKCYKAVVLSILNSVKFHSIPNFDKIFEEICDSNLSKSDDSEHDALLTKQKYETQTIPVETYYGEKFGKFITYRKSDNKVLKSYKYTAVDLAKHFKQ